MTFIRHKIHHYRRITEVLKLSSPGQNGRNFAWWNNFNRQREWQQPEWVRVFTSRATIFTKMTLFV